MDPEGDYEGLGDAVAIGTAAAAPRAEEVLEILRKTATSVAVNLLGVKLEDRPGYFAGLLPELLAHRERTGRPHFVVIGRGTPHAARKLGPRRDRPAQRPARLHVRHRAARGAVPRTLDCVDRALAVGDEAQAALAVFARAHGLAEPDGAGSVERGEVLTLCRTDPAPRRFKVIPGTTERRRHLRKYAEGKLGDDKAFFFRGAEGKLRLRATNLIMFLEMADGVDDETWEWHRVRGDLSAWVETSIKDGELAAEMRAIEQNASPTDEARLAMRTSIERRYTLPA